MKRLQEQVRAFHQLTRQPTSPADPQLRNPEKRAELLLQGAFETAIALVGGRKVCEILTRVGEQVEKNMDVMAAQPDLNESIAGCTGLVLLTIGTFEDIGIEAEPFANEALAVSIGNMFEKPRNGRAGAIVMSGTDVERVIKRLRGET